MGVYDNVEGVARKSMVMFFLIDTSGSMEGRSIAAVNDAMREVIPDVKDISNKNADANIKFAVMSFSSGTNWETPQPVELGSYRWSDLDAGGTTDMGEDDYKAGLKQLQQNKWFKKSIKIALGVDDANMDVMSDFTGSKESAIYLKDKSLLKKLSHVVSVTSSTVASQKVGDGEDEAVIAQETVAETAREAIQDLDPEADEDW